MSVIFVVAVGFFVVDQECLFRVSRVGAGRCHEIAFGFLPGASGVFLVGVVSGFSGR